MTEPTKLHDEPECFCAECEAARSTELLPDHVWIDGRFIAFEEEPKISKATKYLSETHARSPEFLKTLTEDELKAAGYMAIPCPTKFQGLKFCDLYKSKDCPNYGEYADCDK